MNGSKQTSQQADGWDLTWSDAGQTGGMTIQITQDRDLLDDAPDASETEEIIGGWGMMQAAAWNAAFRNPVHARMDDQF